jgi:cytidine deaminase
MPSKKDQELIAAAIEAIRQRYRYDWQEVGAAMRTRDGRIVTGVSRNHRRRASPQAR